MINCRGSSKEVKSGIHVAKALNIRNPTTNNFKISITQIKHKHFIMKNFVYFVYYYNLL